MSESESTPPNPTASSEPNAPPPIVETDAPRPRRLRRFFLLHLPLTVASAVLLLALAITGLFFWASSAGFENFVRKQMVNRLETATGGRVEIDSFHWHLLRLEAEANGLVIHGLEAPGEAPYAKVERMRVRVSILGLWSPHVRLSDLEIFRPQLHLIIYPDGSTNQPQPRKQRKPGKPVLDSFFDLKASHIAVEQGVLDYEDRAATFDFQNRHIPLDFAASDISLLMAYLPAAARNPESYHIEAGARDLNLSRGDASRPGKAQTVHGLLQATLDLTRTTATLRSLRVTASGHGVKDRTLEITGVLNDFAHPHWHGKATGDLDLRLVDAITGYPFTPQGLAHLDIAGAGEAGSFRADGSIHVDDGSYIGTGVVATGFRLDARLHADPEQLLITSIFLHLRQGGQIDGDLSLDHWLPTLPGAARLQPASAAHSKSHGHAQPVVPAKPLASSDEITLPVNGKVTAAFKDVTLDTLLEMLCDPPFQHLGFDTLVNGPANALWINGDNRTLSVSALFSLTAPTQPAPGKTPASGQIDATYTQRDGAVDLRKLELDLPSSQLLAHGHLGAHPTTSPTALVVDFHSGNLSEFDTVLRDLGLDRNGRSGTAALPIALYGQGDFHGRWDGSLVDPRLSGDVKATQLAVELPAAQASSQPQFFRVDSVEATGSYSAARIDITHGLLRRGKAEIDLGGSLAAVARSVTHGLAPIPSFDANSMLHLRLRAGQVGLNDLQPFIGTGLPVAGSLSAQLQVDGPIHALGGSGWVEMDKGTVFGEPVARVRAEANIVNQIINLTSLTVSEDVGKIAATGSYDLQSRRFQLNAQGAGIDMARIEWLRSKGLTVTGKLGFTMLGSGTFDDPHIEAHATLPGLTMNGEPLGDLELEARAANRSVTYDLTTRLEAGDFTAHGQTALTGDYATQAKLEFSRFNIGALLKMAHVRGLSGESALAGTITLEGPLAHLSELRGEARIQQLAVTVAGVPLQSEGGLHVTLDHSVIHLDPLHVTGEETDLRAQGTLSLKDKQQLDFAASGAINLKVAETLDPDLTASGNTSFQVEAHGPLMNPELRGRIDFQDAALSLEDIPNGLSKLHGTLEFNQNRLEVKNLTAMTGGGLLSIGGYLAYQHGLYADLTATGNGIRIRYPQGVSSLADATLHLQGPENNLLLSGDVFITRFTVSPDLDIAALAAQAAAVETIAPLDAPSNHIRLDVHIASSPQLNFQNAYAKLAGNVDLRLRGTVASPSLLGRVSITEGSAIIAGTRYELQRGDIFFTNPVRIEPSIDLNATARVEDYDITLALHGTPEKLSVTYRSDPPLPEADVVALLALGRTESQQRLYTQQQQQALSNPTTDSLLGGALNATVSSRVQRLFGAGSVKVDPNYLGALGNSTSRIIVEEQLGRNLTLTYATNVNTTSQQLIQAEIAINRHVSLQLARDESGVFSVVLKATRRFR
ncbi:MAG: translocation/assembly module TamB domain-containing protein [Terracidiphilus sp.]|jgi:translocation and assembly module TamB